MSELLLRRRNLLIRKQEEELNIRAVCFEADGEQTVAISKVGSAPNITMQYSYNGKIWDDWDLSALPFGGDTKVYIRGVGNVKLGSGRNQYNTISFGTDSFVYVSGIVESLLDSDNEVLSFKDSYSLTHLFYQQKALRSVENLQFEAQISNFSDDYSYMFYNCSNLMYGPKALSIQTFNTNSKNCCEFMFSGCTNLLTAPELPAEKLIYGSYYRMFANCTSLKTIRCHAKVSAYVCTESWLYGITTSGTFYGHSKYG